MILKYRKARLMDQEKSQNKLKTGQRTGFNNIYFYQNQTPVIALQFKF